MKNLPTDCRSPERRHSQTRVIDTRGFFKHVKSLIPHVHGFLSPNTCWFPYWPIRWQHLDALTPAATGAANQSGNSFSHFVTFYFLVATLRQQISAAYNHGVPGATPAPTCLYDARIFSLHKDSQEANSSHAHYRHEYLDIYKLVILHPSAMKTWCARWVLHLPCMYTGGHAPFHHESIVGGAGLWTHVLHERLFPHFLFSVIYRNI